MNDNKINRAYYPVGSAHIYDLITDQKNKDRLASLIAQNKNHNMYVKIKNFYPYSENPNSAYAQVQKDIEGFLVMDLLFGCKLLTIQLRIYKEMFIK